MNQTSISFRTLEPDLSDVDGARATLARPDASPWYVRALVGFSAWLGTMFFLGSLFGLDLFDVEHGALALGFLLIAGSLTARFVAPRQDFVDQLLLSLSLAGMALFTVGVAEVFDSPTFSFFVLFLLSGLTIVFFRDYLHRLFSTLGIVLACFGMIFASENNDLIHPLIALTALGVSALFLFEGRLLGSPAGRHQPPAAIGLALALPGLCLMSVTDSNMEFGARWDFSGIPLLLILLGVVVFIYRAHEGAILMLPVILILLAAVGAILVSAPGVIATLLVLTLGFHRGHRFVAGLGGVALLAYLFYYYYDLDLLLQTKAYILMGSGAAVFAARLLVTRVLFPADGDTGAVE